MLELHDVSIDIAGVPVLRDVHLVVPPGGRVALIGRNGAGKTTTLRTLMGLLPPRAGRVVIDGQEPPASRRTTAPGSASAMRRRNGGCSAASRCGRTCCCRPRCCAWPPAEVARRLDAVFTLLPELKDLAPRRAAGLSGGQGKMVALGRALMVGTRAVLLDEPFQGLAPALALRYAEALKRLHQALPDVAILITESNPELLRPLVERTFVIERGEIAAA